MKFTRRTALGAGAAVAAVATMGNVSKAFAEPVVSSYVLVGSDTLQDVCNALTNGTRISGGLVRVQANGFLGNYDAFGSALIQTKSNGPFFVRPEGSGNGRSALIASITGAAGGLWNGKTITGQVDIGRSSSDWGSNASPDGDLAYVPFGRDAVSYAYNGPAADLGALTTAQLTQIYTATSPVTIGGTVVKPLIPQDGSGTRSFFLKAIGVGALGGTVDSRNNSIPENDGSVLKEVGNIIPFSAANWIAQKNGASGVNTIADGIALGSPNAVAPYTGTTTLAPNASFYGSVYGRDTYLIVEYARINPADPKYDRNLANLMNPNLPTSLVNMGSLSSTAGSVKRRFGFLTPNSTLMQRAYPNVY